MTLHPLEAAKTLCLISDWSVSNLEINKILYIAHMISLRRSEGGKPLVEPGFQAWDYGPVLPGVYRQAKAFGSKSVGNVFHLVDEATDGEEHELIKDIYENLRDWSPGDLISMTHWDNGAWAKHYRSGVHGITIPDDDIYSEYKERLNS